MITQTITLIYCAKGASMTASELEVGEEALVVDIKGHSVF